MTDHRAAARTAMLELAEARRLRPGGTDSDIAYLIAVANMHTLFLLTEYLADLTSAIRETGRK